MHLMPKYEIVSVFQSDFVEERLRGDMQPDFGFSIPDMML
jgi:hypothetical protein